MTFILWIDATPPVIPPTTGNPSGTKRTLSISNANRQLKAANVNRATTVSNRTRVIK